MGLEIGYDLPPGQGGQGELAKLREDLRRAEAFDRNGNAAKHFREMIAQLEMAPPPTLPALTAAPKPTPPKPRNDMDAPSKPSKKSKSPGGAGSGGGWLMKLLTGSFLGGDGKGYDEFTRMLGEALARAQTEKTAGREQEGGQFDKGLTAAQGQAASAQKDLREVQDPYLRDLTSAVGPVQEGIMNRREFGRRDRAMLQQKRDDRKFGRKLPTASLEDALRRHAGTETGREAREALGPDASPSQKQQTNTEGFRSRKAGQGRLAEYDKQLDARKLETLQRQIEIAEAEAKIAELKRQQEAGAQ